MVLGQKRPYHSGGKSFGSSLVEQEAFEALDELIALDDLLPLLFQI
jgi:hypothetical protein